MNQEIFEKLKSVIEKFNGETNITEDTKLKDIDIDSLGFTDLLFDIENEMNIKISDENFENVRKLEKITIRDICDIIERQK